MCDTRHHHTEIPRDPNREDSVNLDVCTFRTRFREGERPRESYAATIGLEDGQLVITFDFRKGGDLLGIETQITVVQGSNTVLDADLVRELLDEIAREVRPFRVNHTVERQIRAYIQELPNAYHGCRSLPSDDQRCRSALSPMDERVQAIPTMSSAAPPQTQI